MSQELDAVKLVVKMIKSGEYPLPTRKQLSEIMDKLVEMSETYEKQHEQIAMLEAEIAKQNDLIKRQMLQIAEYQIKTWRADVPRPR